VNDSSTTHFSVGVISVSVIVKSEVMSSQPSANEFAGLDNKSKKSTAIGVFIFVFCAQSRAPEPHIFFDYVLWRQAGGTGDYGRTEGSP
jgi:hypothetical protein